MARSERFSVVASRYILLFLFLPGSSNLLKADEPTSPQKDDPGLTLTIAQSAGAPPSTLRDVHTVRMAALFVPKGTPPSPFTPPGVFEATFEGDINMRLRDFLIFSAMGNGKLTLTLNGKSVLEVTGDLSQKQSDRVRLGKGKNHLVAVYQPTADSDAEFRLFWNTKTTLPEPVPPMVFTHAADEALAASQRARAGAALLGTLRCTKCHGVSDIVTAGAKDALRELAMDAPSLKDAGARLNAAWMAAWISNPRALRAGAHMPRLFAAKDGAVAPEANDIAAYLATLGAPTGEAPKAASAKAGGRLFASLDCIACHISPERGGAEQSTDAGRISLAYVKAKFRPATLREFLLKPSAHYAWIAMPDFRLSAEEAESLAAYLLSRPGKEIATAAEGNAANGQKLIASAGCMNCHAVAENQPTADIAKSSLPLAKIPKDGWTRGCLATDAAGRKTAPNFSLTEEQRAALTAFATTDLSSLARSSPAEFAERQIVSLRCTACHSRDGHESLLATDLDAENQDLIKKFPPSKQASAEGMAPDQRPPMLTWAGEKLRPQWLAKFLAGEIPYKPRYYLHARMPGFGPYAPALALGLTEQHGCTPSYPAYAPPKADLIPIGQTLVGKIPGQGFSCIQCHAVNQQAALAPFEAPSINFMYVTDRLREDYYYRWIHDPLRIDPETKMPRFDDADGKTGITATFDGDAHKQFEAVWNYLLTGKGIEPPAQ